MNTVSILLRATLKKKKTVIIKLTGRCMSPLLREGDEAEVVSAGKFSLGKLYLFELQSGDIAVHRLIGIFNEELLLKGDRSQGFDVVSRAAVIGEVKAVRLNGKSKWFELYRIESIQKLIATLSEKHMIDKNNYKNTFWSRCMRELSAICLIFYGYAVRTCYMINSYIHRKKK